MMVQARYAWLFEEIKIMRILVDILHPKQAHFFRPLITRWRQQGDIVQIVTRDKDITHQLLDSFGFKYICLSHQRKSVGMLFELMQRWIKLTRLMRHFRPDITLSVTGISTSLPSRILGIPNIAFTDTETATLSNHIAFPFAGRILTPTWFRGDFGIRHYRYKGFHEWCYLHPNEFKPDASIVKAEGLDPEQPYAVVRLVRWDAVHDQREKGFNANEAVILVKQLAERMRVVLSSERQPPPELRHFVSTFRLENIHHIMAFSRLMVGESPSMSTEAALLGVPAILASTWAGRVGNMQILERQFHLIQVFERGQDAISATLSLADNPPSHEKIAAQRASLVCDLDYIPDVVNHHIQELIEIPHG
jgi:predicted glycosyltransferase